MSIIYCTQNPPDICFPPKSKSGRRLFVVGRTVILHGLVVVGLQNDQSASFLVQRLQKRPNQQAELSCPSALSGRGLVLASLFGSWPVWPFRPCWCGRMRAFHPAKASLWTLMWRGGLLSEGACVRAGGGLWWPGQPGGEGWIVRL